jgi:LPXTG-motif cell wall-anchored protein
MRRGVLLIAMILGVISAGTAAAQRLTDPHVIPQASPVLLGTVVGSNVHSVTIETPGGDQLSLETDSRTVMPYNLQDGTRVRAEFHLLDNGMRHAGRITPLTQGGIDWALLDKEISTTQRADYEHELNEDRAMAMQRDQDEENALASGPGAEHHDATTAEHHDYDNDNDRDDQMAQNETSTTSDSKTQTNQNERNDENELPRTASPEPALLAAGMLALGAGLGFAFGRRRVS